MAHMRVPVSSMKTIGIIADKLGYNAFDGTLRFSVSATQAIITYVKHVRVDVIEEMVDSIENENDFAIMHASSIKHDHIKALHVDEQIEATKFFANLEI